MIVISETTIHESNVISMNSRKQQMDRYRREADKTKLDKHTYNVYI